MVCISFVKLEIRIESWISYVCCIRGYLSLLRMRKEKISVVFYVPMMWHEPTSHFNCCCFCLETLEGSQRNKKKNTFQYSNSLLAIPLPSRLIPHGKELSVATPPINFENCSDSGDDNDENI